MTTRRERVIVEAVDHYTGELDRMAAATALFRRSLDQSNSSMGPVRSNLRGMDSDARRASSSIDQLSGRLGLALRAVGAFGPAAVPITTAAVPAITALTTQLGFAALAGGTAMIAFQGVGDALDALEKAKLEPTVENLEAAREAMRGLAPETRAFVREYRGMFDQFRGLRDAAAAGLFPGLTESLDTIETRFPQIAAILEEVGSATGDLLAGGAEALAGEQWDQFFDFLQSEARPALTGLGETLGNATRGVAELLMAMDPLSDDFTAGLVNASADFAQWADDLSSTNGYREFIDYVRETGPMVVDTAGSLANALLQIGEAAAPLGGPALRSLTALAEILATIADSPLGTPLVGIALVVSQLSLLRKALGGVSGLMGRSIPMGAGTMGGLLAGRFTTNRGALTAIRSDIATIGTTWATAGARSTREAGRVATATSRLRTNMGGLARDAGKGGAALAGLGVLATGAGDDLGVTNTASLALMGTMAGPWGAAIGGAAGVLLDLRAASDEAVSSITGLDAAVSTASETGQLEPLAQKLAAARDEYEQFMLLDQNAGTDMLGNLFGVDTKADELRREIDEAGAAYQRMSEYQAAAATDRRFLAMLDAESAALRENVAALRAKQAASLAAFDAETAYRQALVAARQAARGNNAGIRGNTQAALDNRSALSQLAGAWNNQSAAVRNNVGRYREARAAFVNTAVQMGVNRQRAEELAREYLRMPKKVETRVIARDEASDRLSMIRNAIDQIRDKTVTVTTNHVTNYRITRSGTVAETRGYGPDLDNANGGLYENGVRKFADGGWGSNGQYYHRVPQIIRGGANVLWGEQETGWEAYISGKPSMRHRNVSILEEAARRFGYSLSTEANRRTRRFADGGFANAAARSQTGVSVGPRFSQRVNVAAPQMSLAGLTLRAEVDGLGEVMFRVAEEVAGDHRAHDANRSRTVYSGVGSD